MRKIGCFLEIFKIKYNILCLEDLMRVLNWELLVEVVKNLVDFDKEI